MNNAGKTMILGLGNEVLGDEGLGLKIVDDLKKISFHREFEFSKAFNGGLDILDQIRDYKELVVIDTIYTGKAKPGFIHHFTLKDYTETLHLSSQHDVSFHTAIKTGETLGLQIPGKIDILAIEIYPDFQLTDKNSDNIHKQYKKILHEIINFIKNKNIYSSCG